MPGLTHNHGHRKVIKKMAQSQSPELSAFANPQPRYPFQTTTTAYGLNEPQWSFGPPPIRFHESPYARIPLPHLGRASLHALLRPSDHTKPPFEWSVNQPPSSAKISSSSLYANHYHWQALPALDSHSTHQSSLTVRVPSFARPIVIFPSNTNTGVITIGDVLNAIYKGLRQCANDVLCESMQIVPSQLSDQLRTFQHVTLTSLPHVSTVMNGGGDDAVSTHLARHFDFKTRWAGLAPGEAERDVWVLHTNG